MFLWTCHTGVVGLGPGKDKRRRRKTKIYHQLCVIRWERDPVVFERMLPAFVSQLSDEFRSYFGTYYVHRSLKWALCYTNPELPDTTAHPESFHRVLKHVYMEGTDADINLKPINI